MARLPQPSLTPAEFQILLALADGERHGYEILQLVTRESQGAIRLGPTTLYRSLHRLLEAGMIEEADRPPEAAHDDERRRYYRLAPGGWAAARREAERLRALLLVAERKALADPSRRPIGQP